MTHLENTMTTQANPRRPRNGPEAAIDHLTAEDEVRTLLFNRVSWGAVLAGVMVALVTQLILNLIGIGLGAVDVFDTAGNLVQRLIPVGGRPRRQRRGPGAGRSRRRAARRQLAVQ